MSDSISLGLWIKKAIAGLILVPSGPLLAIGIGLLWSRRRRGAGLALAGLGWIVLFVLSLPVVANGIGAPIEKRFPPLAKDATLPEKTAIVVLGGGMQEGALDFGGETINPITLGRLRAAAMIAARTKLPVLVTGGPSLTSKTTEAEHMADALQHEFNTPVRWIENASLDTQDNARRSVPMLKADGITTVVLVTDTTHMTRAHELFQTAGIAVIPAATDFHASGPISVFSFVPNTNALRRSASYLHEWIGLWWARLRG